MSIHPQAQALLNTLPDMDTAAAGFDHRVVREQLAAAGASEDRLEPAGGVIDVDADGVACRVANPGAGRPVLVYLHGGGFTLGDRVAYDAFTRLLAVRTGWAVLFVDYRLAPEHPFPAAVEDCETAFDWLLSHGEDLGVDTAIIAVAGDSAGGNLAAGLARRHAGDIALQVLVYPCFDPAGATTSYREESSGLSPATMDWFWRQYAPDPADHVHPDLNPLVVADLRGLPEALVITAEHDPLRDEGELYAWRLADAGVPSVAVRYLGMPHSFIRRVTILDSARRAVDQVVDAVRRIRAPDLTPEVS